MSLRALPCQRGVTKVDEDALILEAMADSFYRGVSFGDTCDLGSLLDLPYRDIRRTLPLKLSSAWSNEYALHMLSTRPRIGTKLLRVLDFGPNAGRDPPHLARGKL